MLIVAVLCVLLAAFMPHLLYFVRTHLSVEARFLFFLFASVAVVCNAILCLSILRSFVAQHRIVYRLVVC